MNGLNLNPSAIDNVSTTVPTAFGTDGRISITNLLSGASPTTNYVTVRWVDDEACIGIDCSCAIVPLS